MAFDNNCPNLNREETIRQVLTEDVRQKSMSLTIEDNAKAHFLGGTTQNRPKSEPAKEEKQPTMVEVVEQSMMTTEEWWSIDEISRSTTYWNKRPTLPMLYCPSVNTP